MRTKEMIATIDKEILMLQQVRALLSEDTDPSPPIKRLGRPKGSANSTVRVTKSVPRTKQSVRPSGSAEKSAKSPSPEKPVRKTTKAKNR